MANEPTNLLLASLSPPDLKLLAPHLRPLELRQHKILFEAGQSVSTVYFPYDAIVSLVVTLSTGEVIEAAMVGRDGVIGALAALDGRISLSRAVVQISGHGAMCDVFHPGSRRNSWKSAERFLAFCAPGVGSSMSNHIGIRSEREPVSNQSGGLPRESRIRNVFRP